MSKFISISGPSSTGKTSLAEYLSSCNEFSKAVFVPDVYNTVWEDLVRRGIFQSYDEIIKDSEYICIYLLKLLDYYNLYQEDHAETDDLVVFDCCWIDLLIYSLLNMWAIRPIKSLQEDILGKILKLQGSIDNIYMTSFDSSKHTKQKFREEFKIYSAKDNRNLELLYYEALKNFKHVTPIPSTDIKDSAAFIITDLKKLGYL